MTVVNLYNLGALGVNKDSPAHTLPPEFWSDANNVRFYKKQAMRMLGHEQVFGTPLYAPGFLFNVPSPTQDFWFYFDTANAGVYDGAHADVTKVSGAYTASNYRDWTGCMFGGIPIFNNGSDRPQWWPALSTSTPLEDLDNWPTDLRARVVKNFGRYLVALNLQDGASALPHAVQWSHKADPGTVPASWDPGDPTKDSGRTHLTDAEGGQILDGLLLGNAFVIYKENSAHLMRFVGGVDKMGFDKLFDQGVLATRCAALIDGGRKHFVVTQDDVIVHAGTKESQSVLQDRDRDFLFADMDPITYLNAIAFDNPAYGEAWFAYPSSGFTNPNKVMIYSYLRGAGGPVTFRDWDGTSAALGNFAVDSPAWDDLTNSWDEQTKAWDNQERRKLLYGAPDLTKIFSLDTGYSFGGGICNAYLERTGLAITGKNRQGEPIVDYNSRKQIKRVWPVITGNGQIFVRVGKQEHINDDITWCAPKLYNPEQKYLDFDNEAGASGRLNAIRIESADDNAWQLEGLLVDITVVSEQ